MNAGSGGRSSLHAHYTLCCQVARSVRRRFCFQDVHEPALAAVCHRCNVAGLSPDAGLREKCIAAGVPAAKGTGRPEDFARTAADEPGVGPSGGLNSTLESPAAVALTAAVLIVALIAGGSWFKGRRGSPLGAGSTAQPLRVSAPRDDADVANPSADMK